MATVNSKHTLFMTYKSNPMLTYQTCIYSQPFRA